MQETDAVPGNKGKALSAPLFAQNFMMIDRPSSAAIKVSC
jgi:hypothetical protein